MEDGDTLLLVSRPPDVVGDARNDDIDHAAATQRAAAAGDFIRIPAGSNVQLGSVSLPTSALGGAQINAIVGGILNDIGGGGDAAAAMAAAQAAGITPESIAAMTDGSSMSFEVTIGPDGAPRVVRRPDPADADAAAGGGGERRTVTFERAPYDPAAVITAHVAALTRALVDMDADDAGGSFASTPGGGPPTEAPAAEAPAAEAPAAEATAAPLSATPDARNSHAGVQCDACGIMPITGERYKSIAEGDYDLCAACHDSGRGTQAPHAPFARLPLPLPGMMPPPTSAPRVVVDANRAEASPEVGGVAAAQATATAPAAAGTETRTQTQTQTPPPPIVRRVPPVVTSAEVSNLLRTGADVVERAMPRIRTAASDIEAAASASRMDADAARGQSSALRAAMTLHNAGSLLMDLARMAMSVQLNGDVAAPPPFLSTESFLAGGAIGAGEATNAADATTSTETDAEATDPFSASGPTTTRMTPVAANAPDDSNFLAPALMYLDPRGGTQPLSGLGMRPSVRSAGLSDLLGGGGGGGGAHGGLSAQLSGLAGLSGFAGIGDTAEAAAAAALERWAREGLMDSANRTAPAASAPAVRPPPAPPPVDRQLRAAQRAARDAREAVAGAWSDGQTPPDALRQMLSQLESQLERLQRRHDQAATAMHAALAIRDGGGAGGAAAPSPAPRSYPPAPARPGGTSQYPPAAARRRSPKL